MFCRANLLKMMPLWLPLKPSWKREARKNMKQMLRSQSHKLKQRLFLKTKTKILRKKKSPNLAALTPVEAKVMILHNPHPKSSERKIEVKRRNKRKGGLRKLRLLVTIARLIIPILVLVRYLPPKNKKLCLTVTSQ